MTMPIDLVLVRHGESEGNIAVHRSKHGDDSAFTPEFLERHSSRWRLTDKGLAQAKMAGAWIRANLDPRFDRYYVSEYYRALETAALLNLPGAQWYREFYLRERDFGFMDVMSEVERKARFAEALRAQMFEPFFYAHPNGESMATLCLRIDRVLHTLHRECADKRVIVVCHGEVMWAFRIRLERMTPRLFQELDATDNPLDHIYNCQIFHYSRRNPETQVLETHLNWMRSVCPTDLSLSRNTWQRIERRTASNEELLKEVRKTKRFISG